MKKQTISLVNLVGLAKKGMTDGSSSSNSGGLGLKRTTTSIADFVGFKRDKTNAMDQSADSHNSNYSADRNDRRRRRRRVARTKSSDGSVNPRSLEELEALTNDLERMALALRKVQDPEKILRKHVKQVKTPAAA